MEPVQDSFFAGMTPDQYHKLIQSLEQHLKLLHDSEKKLKLTPLIDIPEAIKSAMPFDKR